LVQIVPSLYIVFSLLSLEKFTFKKKKIHIQEENMAKFETSFNKCEILMFHCTFLSW